jgi:hypothetical protein
MIRGQSPLVDQNPFQAMERVKSDWI